MLDFSVFRSDNAVDYRMNCGDFRCRFMLIQRTNYQSCLTNRCRDNYKPCLQLCSISKRTSNEYTCFKLIEKDLFGLINLFVYWRSPWEEKCI